MRDGLDRLLYLLRGPIVLSGTGPFIIPVTGPFSAVRDGLDRLLYLLRGPLVLSGMDWTVYYTCYGAL